MTGKEKCSVSMFLSCTFIHPPFNSSSTHAGGMLLTDEADDMEMLNTEQAEKCHI